MYNFDVWEDACESLKQNRRDRAKALIKKYNLPINENNLEDNDWFEYEAVKDEIRELEASQNFSSFTMKEESNIIDDLQEQAKSQNNTLPQYSAKRQETLGDKLAETIATSDSARKAALAMQGISDSYFNPAGLGLRAYNKLKGGSFETGLQRIEPENTLEQAIETGANFIYDIYALPTTAAALYKGGVKGARLADKAFYDYQGNRLAKSYDKVYDQLLKRNLSGKSEDVLNTIYLPPFKNNVFMQRGAAAFTEDGKLITQGKDLRRATKAAGETVTESNFGMTKVIGTHNMEREDIRQIPRILAKNKPAEVTKFQKFYRLKDVNGKERVLALSKSPIKGKMRDSIVSYYRTLEDKTPITDFPPKLPK